MKQREAGLKSSQLRPIPRSFYQRNTLEVARALPGLLLVRRYSSHTLVGRICEVEAYRGSDDPASHAHRGLTERNRIMFGPPGHAYIYFIYGNHWCLNIVSEPAGTPGAVLVRAIEPLLGISEMRRNRRVESLDPHRLTDGPGKITQALKISGEMNGLDLTRMGPLFISRPETQINFEIAASSRMGINPAQDRPWRFYIEDSPYVARKRVP